MSIPYYMIGTKYVNGKKNYGRDFIGGKASWYERQSGDGAFLALRREILEELYLLESPYGIAPPKQFVDWIQVKKNSPSRSFMNAVCSSTMADKSKLNNWFKEHKHSLCEGSITIKVRYLYNNETHKHYEEFYLTPHTPEDFQVPKKYNGSTNQYFIDVQEEFYSHNGNLESLERMCTEIFGADGYGDIDVSGDRLACGVLKRVNIPDDRWREFADCYDEGQLLNTIWDEYAERAIAIGKAMDNPCGRSLERIRCKKMKSHIQSLTEPADCYEQEYIIDIIYVTKIAYKIEVSLYCPENSIPKPLPAATSTDENKSVTAAIPKCYYAVLLCENRYDHQLFRYKDDTRSHRAIEKFAKVLNHQLYKSTWYVDDSRKHPNDVRMIYFGDMAGTNKDGAAIGASSSKNTCKATTITNPPSPLEMFIRRVMQQLDVEEFDISIITTGDMAPGGEVVRALVRCAVADSNSQNINFVIKFVEMEESGCCKVFVCRNEGFDDYSGVRTKQHHPLFRSLNKFQFDPVSTRQRLKASGSDADTSLLMDDLDDLSDQISKLSHNCDIRKGGDHIGSVFRMDNARYDQKLKKSTYGCPYQPHRCGDVSGRHGEGPYEGDGGRGRGRGEGRYGGDGGRGRGRGEGRYGGDGGRGRGRGEGRYEGDGGRGRGRGEGRYGSSSEKSEGSWR